MDRRVEAVLLRIAAEWQRDLRVADLAASVNLGPSRLEHLFKESVRMSIREMLHRRRMSEAARLLVTTYARVSEISYNVGFRDVSNFNHAFRKEFSVSPREYRRRVGMVPPATESK
ncbi:MAG TPA: helix-turn-helix transcriptional regulator [Thermoanaerobaculia bacterium]|nr:helix-turn-helix transcriptional regulator [Thermoanaerobaculia bacterium]